MDLLSPLLTNGFIPLLPILLLNIVLAKRLPPPYSTDQFDRPVPVWLLRVENIFRLCVFLLPLMVRLDLSAPLNKIGCALYLIGSLFYFGSWLLLIVKPEVRNNILLFSAPAWTPAIWLLGLSLMMQQFLIGSFPFSTLYYLVPVSLFLTTHIAHTIIAIRNVEI